jgi:hypothetical protein
MHMGGRKSHEGGSVNNRNKGKRNYATNEQERQGVYEELIGSYSNDEIGLFTPWIDRDEWGNLVDNVGQMTWNNQGIAAFEKEYNEFASKSAQNLNLLKKYEKVFGVGYR